MTEITKEMTIGEVLQLDRATAPIFFSFGMHCLGCVMASGEDLEQACAVHGINVDELVDKLNAYLEAK